MICKRHNYVCSNISSIFSRYSEAFAWEYLENNENMLPRYWWLLWRNGYNDIMTARLQRVKATIITHLMLCIQHPSIMILMLKSMQLFFYWWSDFNTRETFRHDYLEILKRMLQNFYKIVMKCSFCTSCIVTYAPAFNPQIHYIVSSVVKL